MFWKTSNFWGFIVFISKFLKVFEGDLELYPPPYPTLPTLWAYKTKIFRDLCRPHFWLKPPKYICSRSDISVTLPPHLPFRPFPIRSDLMIYIFQHFSQIDERAIEHEKFSRIWRSNRWKKLNRDKDVEKETLDLNYNYFWRSQSLEKSSRLKNTFN